LNKKSDKENLINSNESESLNSSIIERIDQALSQIEGTRSELSEIKQQLLRSGKRVMDQPVSHDGDIIEVGDIVASKTASIYQGVVTRFSEDYSFIFIQTDLGREESKAPRNLVVLHKHHD